MSSSNPNNRVSMESLSEDEDFMHGHTGSGSGGNSAGDPCHNNNNNHDLNNNPMYQKFLLDSGLNFCGVPGGEHMPGHGGRPLNIQVTAKVLFGSVSAISALNAERKKKPPTGSNQPPPSPPQ